METSERTPEDTLMQQPSTVLLKYRRKDDQQIYWLNESDVMYSQLHLVADHHVFQGTFIPRM